MPCQMKGLDGGPTRGGKSARRIHARRRCEVSMDLERQGSQMFRLGPGGVVARSIATKREGGEKKRPPAAPEADETRPLWTREPFACPESGLSGNLYRRGLPQGSTRANGSLGLLGLDGNRDLGEMPEMPRRGCFPPVDHARMSEEPSSMTRKRPGGDGCRCTSPE